MRECTRCSKKVIEIAQGIIDRYVYMDLCIYIHMYVYTHIAHDLAAYGARMHSMFKEGYRNCSGDHGQVGIHGSIHIYTNIYRHICIYIYI